MESEEKIEHLNDYIKHRIDIIMSNVNRWFICSVDTERASAYYQLPTFEYYLENCVNDKDGKYDFTRVFARTHIKELPTFKDVGHNKLKNTKITRHYTYSIWMGTEFNHKQVITL